LFFRRPDTTGHESWLGWFVSPLSKPGEIGQLAGLLVDAVDSGASAGFMPPLSHDLALDCWHGVVRSLDEGSRVLLVAMKEDVVEGAPDRTGNTRQRQPPRRSNEAVRPSARTPAWSGESANG
jgi:hypothetical protein